MTHRRMLLAAATTAALGLATPATAGAVTATVTGDDGAPIPLSSTQPTQIRNMSPVLGLGFAAGEQNYSVKVTGPDGSTVANIGEYCLNTSSYEPEKVKYLGNGTYTATVKTGNSEERCGAKTTTFSFSVVAGTAVAQPTGKFLLRRPNQTAYIPYDVPVSGNPGADDIEVRYGRAATLAPDGGISTESSRASYDPATGLARVTFLEAGTYTFVSRATDFGGASTAWSPPVQIVVVSPFDFVGGPGALSFPDSRGPIYRITSQVREDTARGKVRVYLAKGRKGGKFRKVKTVKIRRGGRISVRFRETRVGRFRIRYRFKGSRTTAGGTLTYGIKVRQYRF